VEYLDLEIEIGEGVEREYPVTVLRSPAGEPRHLMKFPFDDLELQNRLQSLEIALLRSSGVRRRMLTAGDKSIQDFGESLFQALFDGDVGTCFELSRRDAELGEKGLRLKLRIKAPELASLPWELLFDPRQSEYLALSTASPIVRYVDLPRAIKPLRVAPPLRVLGMMASPDDQTPLNVEREQRRVTDALNPLQAAGLVEFGWVEGGTWRDLQRAMRQGPWHLFHFVGHGRYDAGLDEGIVALCGDRGGTKELSATQLGRLLADHPSMRMVLLNSCEGARGGTEDIFSGTASILVRRGIPAVLAMQYEISDVAALEFSRSFYEAVSTGLPVDTAVTEARKAISVSGPATFEWGTPVLYMRTSESSLFDISGGAGTWTDSRPPKSAELATAAGDDSPSAPQGEGRRRRSLAIAAAASALVALIVAIWMFGKPSSDREGEPQAMGLSSKEIAFSVLVRGPEDEFGNVLIGGGKGGCNYPCAEDGDIYVWDPLQRTAVAWTFGSRNDKDPHVLPDGSLAFNRDGVPSVISGPGEKVQPYSSVPESTDAWDVSSKGVVVYSAFPIEKCLCLKRPGETPIRLDVGLHTDRFGDLPYVLEVKFSPEGERLAFVDSKNRLYLVDISGDIHGRISRTLLHRHVQGFDWSPSGDKIVLSAYRQVLTPGSYCNLPSFEYTESKGCPASWDLFTIDLASRHALLMTNTNADEISPEWSSSNQLAFIGRKKDGTPEAMWVLPVDEPGATRQRIDVPFTETTFAGLTWGASSV
jgi:hypothetical protein